VEEALYAPTALELTRVLQTFVHSTKVRHAERSRRRQMSYLPATVGPAVDAPSRITI